MFLTLLIMFTNRVPVDGKSSVCLICMKYTIIIFIIIFISLGQILLSYIENTSRTHALARTRARTHARTHTRTHTHRRTFQVSAVRFAAAPNRDGPFRCRQWASLFHSNNHTRGRSGFPRFCVFFAYKKIARPK